MLDFRSKPILQVLSAAGIELDQRLSTAIKMAGRVDEHLTDSELFHALFRLNAIHTRFLKDLPLSKLRWKAYWKLEPDAYFAQAKADSQLTLALNKAIDNLKDRKTLGSRDVLKAIIDLGLEKGDSFAERPLTIGRLIQAAGSERSTPLSKVPSLAKLLIALNSSINSDEDFQFLLTLNSGQIAFRLASVLDDYVQSNDSGILLPQRALITHFKDCFGGFTTDEIEELEELLNNPKVKESQFQDYFERHPHYLRKWDYREIYPQMTLYREEGPLIPDFILTDRQLQKAAILDLKLPQPKLVRRQDNRDRFSASVMEARTQLLRYRDWFRERSNRDRLTQSIGMSVYEPHLIVIIGRSSEFTDEFDRQQLRADNPEIELVTYDDILTFAKRRRLIIAGQDV